MSEKKLIVEKVGDEVTVEIRNYHAFEAATHLLEMRNAIDDAIKKIFSGDANE